MSRLCWFSIHIPTLLARPYKSNINALSGQPWYYHNYRIGIDGEGQPSTNFDLQLAFFIRRSSNKKMEILPFCVFRDGFLRTVSVAGATVFPIQIAIWCFLLFSFISDRLDPSWRVFTSHVNLLGDSNGLRFDPPSERDFMVVAFRVILWALNSLLPIFFSAVHFPLSTRAFFYGQAMSSKNMR